MRILLTIVLVFASASHLYAQKGFVVIAPDPGGVAVVRLDGDSVGVLGSRELTVESNPGKRTVIIERRGFLPFRVAVTVVDGDVVQVRPKLELAVKLVTDENAPLASGMLRVRLIHLEPVAVSVGSWKHDLGSTPLTVDMPAGDNLVTIGRSEVCVRGTGGARGLVRLRAGALEDVRGVSSCGVKQPDIDEEPVFTPYTVKPVLQNREEVSKALVKNYPTLLRDAGTSGKVIVWMLIASDGTVRRASVKETSGYAEMDAAAVRVAHTMRFTPAINGATPVKVWIALPIYFATK